MDSRECRADIIWSLYLCMVSASGKSVTITHGTDVIDPFRPAAAADGDALDASGDGGTERTVWCDF